MRSCRLKILSLLILMGVLAVPSEAKLPKDAQDLLNSLPGKSVGLDVVLSRAMQASDSFKAVESAFPSIEAPELEANAPLDWQLSFEIQKLDDRREPTNAFAPTRTDTFGAKISASKYFLTGTSLSAEISDSRTELIFPSQTIPPFVLADTTLTVSQSLWKDAFGYSTRRSLQAGTLQKKAAELQFEDSVDTWTLQLAGVFYNAWLAQSRAVASDESAKRREKLLRVTRRKFRRGTAEKPDVLQVESFLLDDRTKQKAADLELGNRWRDLVIALKLNPAWLRTVDPKEIPITLDSPVEDALKDCGPQEKLMPTPKSNVNVESAKLAAESSRFLAEAAKNAAKPDVKLFGSVYTNGVDPNGGTAVSEMFSFDNPGWAVGVSISLPLSQYAERAAARRAVTQQMLSEAQASIAQDQIKLDWLKGCLDMHRLQQTYELRKKAHENQKERARLDQKRFAIGRVPTITVVQSEDEATRAELDLRQAEINRRLAAWNVRRLQGKIKPYLMKLRDLAASVKVNETTN